MMVRRRVRHLPVIEDGRVIGIVSAGDLMSRRTEYLNRQVEERTRELKGANDELMARDAELSYNLRAAGRFQTRLLLPHAPPDWPELRWGVHYAPLDHLGGDYYDVAQPDPDHLGFLIADASGHSIAAMMVAIMSRSAFAEAASSTTSPGAVLTAMNDRLQGLADERFVTAFYGVLDRRTSVLTYANAGHPYPLLRVAATGEVQHAFRDRVHARDHARRAVPREDRPACRGRPALLLHGRPDRGAQRDRRDVRHRPPEAVSDSSRPVQRTSWRKPSSRVKRTSGVRNLRR